jgi:tRNA pseudouridine38-40 synthase
VAPVRTFRLVLAYDGTDFHGWQIQPAQRTVQGVVREALAEVLADGVVDLHGAGRTDAGVHARGQVASFRSATRLPARAIAAELARRLPRDVAVRSVAEAEDDFHARHSAIARHYTYRTVEYEDPRWERFAWHPPRMPAVEALDLATRVLEGVHDCSSFKSSGSSPADPMCRIVRARWRAWEFGSMFEIVADHFLYHMVRNVVGTAFAAARVSDPAAAMRRVLAARDRSAGGLAAPAHGLSLEHVFYPPEVPV